MENKKSSGMGKYIWVLIILLILWGAIELFGKDKSTSDNLVENNNASTTSELVNVVARGNEPGWYISIQGDSQSANTLLTVDYGESSFTGTLGRSFQESYEDEFQFRGFLNPSPTSTITEQKDFIVYFKKEVCTDDAGNSHEYSADINMHSEKDYKGCADLN